MIIEPKFVGYFCRRGIHDKDRRTYIDLFESKWLVDGVWAHLFPSECVLMIPPEGWDCD